MLPRLRIPEWKPPADGEAGGVVDDTPREGAAEPRLPSSLPSSPSSRKTKSRAARAYMRTNSLKDAKVLVVSDMHRTESVLDPSLFQYHRQFDSPWQLVGKTHLSEVFRVRHRISGQVFAVKRSRRRFRSKLQRERCLREIRAVAALPPHANIVNQYRAWQEGGHFYIQMDYCAGGSLAQQASRAFAQGRCLSDEQLWTIACQAAQGLRFLHSHGVLHLDIKPDNIYLDLEGLPGAAAAGPVQAMAATGAAGTNGGGCGSGCGGGNGGASSSGRGGSTGGTWRIGDFGLAVARDGGAGGMDWEEGDGDYVAPELLAAGGEPSPAADIFSLGATLYQCVTGRKLARSEGWSAAEVERLEVPQRPAAFVQLLRAMLQPHPTLRPSAQQVLEAVEREQPAIAAAAAATVAAAAAEAIAAAAAEAVVTAAVQAQAAAQAAATGGANDGCQQQRVHWTDGRCGLVASPFMQSADPPPRDSSASPQLGLAAVPAAAAASVHFSFDVPQEQRDREPSFEFTPGPPLRPHNPRAGGGGGPPGTAVKSRASGDRGRAGGRWAPALSPLISEGALTPGAVAALAGLTPLHDSGGGGAPTPVLGARPSSSGSGGRAATPLDLLRPAPLQLPIHSAAVPMALGSGDGSGLLLMGCHQPSSAGTQDSREGWRLSRRDMLSPDSDIVHGSARTDSDDYSYGCGTGGGGGGSDYSFSCGTGRTMSELEFADALPPSPLGQGHGSVLAAPSSTGVTPASATPDSLAQQAQHRDQQHSVHSMDALAAAAAAAVAAHDTPSADFMQQDAAKVAAAAAPEAASVDGAGCGGGGSGIARHLMQVAPSLTWDLHTSPEFLMQLPPGSPDSLSRSSSLDDAGSLPSRTLSVRRFPTLDSWGSQLDACGNSKPPSHMDSLAEVAAQRFTSAFAAGEAPPLGGSATGGVGAGAGGGGGHGGGRGLRKRQHSSRRALMAALSRDNSIASIDSLQPLGKSRHIMAAEHGGGGGEGAGAGASGAAAATDHFHQHPPRCGSSLGCAALGASSTAVVAGQCGALAAMGSGIGGAAAVGGSWEEELVAASTRAACLQGAMPPPLPLHARMTCMKLRDGD